MRKLKDTIPLDRESLTACGCGGRWHLRCDCPVFSDARPMLDGGRVATRVRA